jgi:NAD(P)H-hydrate epimerase
MALLQPDEFYDAQQSRAVDRCAIETCGLPGPVLMARAARAAFRELLRRVREPDMLQVLCGNGNNGGDGLLLAALARGRGIPVAVFLVGGEPKSPDAVRAAQRARAAGCELQPFSAAALRPGGVVVDAMLGTGIRGAPRPEYCEAIEAVNALGLPVLALDVPSGLEADTGHAEGPAVRAHWTVSFITAKRGLYTGAGPNHAGARVVDDLEVPAEAYAAAGAAVSRLSLQRELRSLPALRPAAHKGHFGRCLLVGGDQGMGGAVLLAAEAALRSGVGLLRVATQEAHLAPLLSRTPEAMPVALRGHNDLAPLLDWADAVVLGPGLGQGPWGEQLLRVGLASGKPLLLDADALNLVAAHRLQLPPRTLITPHPGEAGRLLGCDSFAVQRDRFAAMAALRSATGADAVVLKGVGSLVGDGDRVALCAAGNPGMASGGMGDVLSGIAGALLAQGLAPGAAARLGCVLHAEAGDRAAQRLGQRALLASDLARELPGLLQ